VKFIYLVHRINGDGQARWFLHGSHSGVDFFLRVKNRLSIDDFVLGVKVV
jgi:hypothetical protein